MLKFMEPEAEVKLVQNFYYKTYLVCISEAGKEVLQPAPVNSLRLRLRYDHRLSEPGRTDSV